MNDCADSTVLRACFEELVATWPAPSLYTRMSALDAVFAFRLLLGRNPAQGAELTQLVECCNHITLREFLASVLASEEFSRQPRFIPPHHLLMAELTEFRFWFDTTDTEMGVKMGFGLYEPETIDFFRRVVRPGMTCWDIGAQTGFFTCLFCALAGESGTVVSYEPMPKSFQVLQKNIVENGYASRVDARQAACSDATGQVAVASVAGMYVVDSAAGAQSIDCVRLDQEDLPVPHIIKIDVEGHEPAVMRGLAGVLAASDPMIVLELNEYWLRRSADLSARQVLRNLSEAGFEVARIDAPSVPIDWSEFQQGELGNCNVVAWRRPDRGKLDRSPGRDTVLPDAVIRRS